MRRRNFLALAIGATMVAGWRPFRDLAGAGPGSDPSIGLIAGRTAELFRDPAGAKALGRAFLQTDRPGRAGLVAELAGRLGPDFATVDVATLRRRLMAWIRRDYEMDDTVLVRGWVLARTEACACAVLAIT